MIAVDELDFSNLPDFLKFQIKRLGAFHVAEKDKVWRDSVTSSIQKVLDHMIETSVGVTTQPKWVSNDMLLFFVFGHFCSAYPVLPGDLAQRGRPVVGLRN